MAIKGRLTQERFGPSMPVNAPLYQYPPFYYKDARMALFQYVTDGELAAEILPAPLELTDPATAVLALLEFPWTTLGPYQEAIQYLICTQQGRPVRYVSHIFVTTDVAMAAGREAYGYPKKIAHIEFVRENEILAGYVERPRGLRICSGVIRPERPVDPSSMPVLPSVCLRMIPGERGSSFAELIEVGSDTRFKEVWEGPGSCHFTGASELDPWHRIPMREILTCRYAIADFELKQGRVLERM
jgi:acetoacetate decarboxylase